MCQVTFMIGWNTILKVPCTECVLTDPFFFNQITNESCYWCINKYTHTLTRTRVKVKHQRHFRFYTEHNIKACARTHTHKHKGLELSVKEKLFRIGVTRDLAFDLATLLFKPPLLKNSPQRALNPTQSRWGRRTCGPFSFICLKKAGVVRRHPDWGWIHYLPPSLKNPHAAHTRPLHSSSVLAFLICTWQKRHLNIFLLLLSVSGGVTVLIKQI